MENTQSFTLLMMLMPMPDVIVLLNGGFAFLPPPRWHLVGRKHMHVLRRSRLGEFFNMGAQGHSVGIFRVNHITCACGDHVFVNNLGHLGKIFVAVNLGFFLSSRHFKAKITMDIKLSWISPWSVMSVMVIATCSIILDTSLSNMADLVVEILCRKTWTPNFVSGLHSTITRHSILRHQRTHPRWNLSKRKFSLLSSTCWEKLSSNGLG